MAMRLPDPSGLLQRLAGRLTRTAVTAAGGGCRAVRTRYWLDGRPMRRRIDRLQAWIGGLLLAGMLVGAPAAAATAGLLVWHAGVHAGLHRVPAVLTQDVGRVVGGRAAARWTAPDGSPRFGQIDVDVDVRQAHATAGTMVAIWIDQRGTVTGEPSRQRVWMRSVLAAVLAWNTVSLMVWGTRRMVWRMLDRHRMQRWAELWRSVQPDWSRRYGQRA